MRKKISIEQNLIDHGTQRSRCMCPIANGCESQGLLSVNVFYSYVTFLVATAKGLVYAKADLPVRARRFIKRFDDGRPTKPFKFFLNIPD